MRSSLNNSLRRSSKMDIGRMDKRRMNKRRMNNGRMNKRRMDKGRMDKGRTTILPTGFARGWFALALALSTLVAAQAFAQAPTLASLRATIDAEYTGTEWVSAGRLRRWMAGPEAERPLLLDVRTAEEFAVSHLRGARRIDPDADPVVLSEPHERTVVVYCSVGYRSAAIITRLRAAGFTRIYNLEGGLFGWANGGGPLYRGVTRVQRVHPYDAEWGRLLNDDRRAPLH